MGKNKKKGDQMNTSTYKIKVYRPLIGTKTKKIIEIADLSYIQAKPLKELFKELKLEFDIRLEER